MDRWYLYKHKEGKGLATSLIPPLDNPNAADYDVTGPFGNKEVIDRFMEIHSANCKAKRVGASGATGGGNLEGQDGSAQPCDADLSNGWG